MAQLDVQPKQRSPIWIWIVLAVVLLGVIFLLARGCNKSYQPTALKTTDVDSVGKNSTNNVDSAKTVATSQPDWESVDFDLARSSYNEVTDTAIAVRGNTKYTIYGLGENVLFAPNDSKLQGSADGRLQMIINSLNKRFKYAAIGVYGHTDSTGTTEQNRSLGAKRANAVTDWLVNKGGLAREMISVHSLGESQPIAENGSARGRQQNRSVEIVAFPRDTVKN
ncbi:OmpA family protein [Mucilaginibacter terrenus]|uniref:OmpA family protein n=1 Tax=Mucilaginibacter terrenus TaxID=2482727 RepID=A0A3E2NUI7_9SPHI|nr:OmpA family protein [Mucilaginibacter terrenus]RFZ84676.1 OmpA family protein [Mucilaginibacter terrenus]